MSNNRITPSDSRSFFAENRVGETNKMIGELAEQDLSVGIVHVSHFFWRCRCNHQQDDNHRLQTVARYHAATRSLRIMQWQHSKSLCKWLYYIHCIYKDDVEGSILDHTFYELAALLTLMETDL